MDHVQIDQQKTLTRCRSQNITQNQKQIILINNKIFLSKGRSAAQILEQSTQTSQMRILNNLEYNSFLLLFSYFGESTYSYSKNKNFFQLTLKKLKLISGYSIFSVTKQQYELKNEK